MVVFAGGAAIPIVEYVSPFFGLRQPMALPNLELRSYVSYYSTPGLELDLSYNCVTPDLVKAVQVPGEVNVFVSARNTMRQGAAFYIPLKIVNKSTVGTQASELWIKAKTRNNWVVHLKRNSDLLFGNYAWEQWTVLKIPWIGPNGESKIDNVMLMTQQEHLIGSLDWKLIDSQAAQVTGTINVCRAKFSDNISSVASLKEVFTATLAAEKARCTWLKRTEPMTKNQFANDTEIILNNVSYCNVLDGMRIP